MHSGLLLRCIETSSDLAGSLLNIFASPDFNMFHNGPSVAADCWLAAEEPDPCRLLDGPRHARDRRRGPGAEHLGRSPRPERNPKSFSGSDAHSSL